MSQVAIETPVLIDGRVYTSKSGVTLSEEARAKGEKDYARALVRERITRKSGDNETRAGINADMTAVLIARFCSMVEKLAQAKTVEQVREAAGEHMGFVNAIRGVRLTAEGKGIDESKVIADYGMVSGAVVEAVNAAKKGG